MKSQTSLVAQQTRLNQWAEQIRECNNRPQGMTVDEWCLENGITRANYYWRLRKVRETLLTVAENATNSTFVELKEPEAAPISIKQEEDSSPKIVAVMRTNQCSIEITDQASTAFLHDLIGAISHA
ncbi:MAG: IS66 family insertion sequence element accessory protein TnpB [Lachnospiraceae bacterium]|nr:IS66 family insertion sequence element accessory protein TnpB [Lachnospiraceae bacterium]